MHCIFIIIAVATDTIKPPTEPDRLTPTRSGRTSPSVTKTLPRKLSNPFSEEKKPKSQPKYGGFGGFGISYSSPKSPMTSPSPDQRSPTPETFTKSPEQSTKSTPQASPEPTKESKDTKLKETSTSKAVEDKSMKKEEPAGSKPGGGMDWRERIKERQRLREQEEEKEKKEREQRAKEREQRAKEREQRFNEQSSNVTASKDSSSSSSSTTATTPSKQPPATASPVPPPSPSTPSSPTKRVSNRFTTSKEEDKTKKQPPKYGGFSGFGISYGAPKPKTPSPTPEKAQTRATLEKPLEPERKEVIIKDSTRNTTSTNTSSSNSSSTGGSSTDTKNVSSSTSTSSKKQEVVPDKERITRDSTSRVGRKKVEPSDDETSSSSSTSLSSNSSSSFSPKSAGSNTSLNRYMPGRQSDAGISYFSTSSRNKLKEDTPTVNSNINLLDDNKNKANLLKNGEEENTTPPIITRSDDRWSDRNKKEAREEKERLRNELEREERNKKSVTPSSPQPEKVQMRRRVGSKSSKENAIGAFYRRRSRMVDSEESSESKSPTPFQQRSSTSPAPARSPSPRPSSPRQSPNLSSESSVSVGSVDSLSPPTVRESVKTSPKSLAPPLQNHTPPVQHVEEKEPTKSTSFKQPPASSSKIETIPENGQETPTPPPKESPATIHTWRQSPVPQKIENVQQQQPQQHPEEERGRIGTASNRIAQQKIKMMALMDDEETLIESTKVEVNRIQPKKEVCSTT